MKLLKEKRWKPVIRGVFMGWFKSLALGGVVCVPSRVMDDVAWGRSGSTKHFVLGALCQSLSSSLRQTCTEECTYSGWATDLRRTYSLCVRMRARWRHGKNAYWTRSGQRSGLGLGSLVRLLAYCPVLGITKLCLVPRWCAWGL